MTVIEPMENDFRHWMVVEAFQAGDMSLGQLAEALDKNKHQTLKLLGELNIPFADYDLQQDLETLDQLFPV